MNLLINKKPYLYMSSPRKTNSYLSLRQLHLIPHFIYLVQKKQFESDKEYALEIWKDDNKIAVETEMLKNDSNGYKKYASLQFNNIRFVFDVQGLFQQKSQASIVFKLTQKSSQQQNYKLIDQFHLHILYYNYEYSNDKFVRHKQNSVGKLSNNIFNYSFSAIYGEQIGSLLFRKHENKRGSVLFEDLMLSKKDSKYGLIVKDEKKTQNLGTIFLIQSVTAKGIEQLKKQRTQIENNPQSMNSKLINSTNTPTNIEDPEQDVLQNARNTARSILDDVARVHEDSTSTEHDLIQQLKMKSKNISTLFLILISSYLIFYLMHPIKKI